MGQTGDTMKTPLLAALIAVTALTGCSRISGSRLNPLNWFGASTEETRTTSQVRVETVERRDTRPLVNQITALRVDRVPSGAIVYATGLPPSQGFFAADLVQRNGGVAENGVLVLDFVAIPPRTQTAVGTQRSREITAALFMSEQSLQGVRSIVVRGLSNQRSVRR